jgi:putative PIN family toxin of toxin-antitoxin system
LTNPESTDPGRLRVVFDTNVVIPALAFTVGRLAWLRAHWRERKSAPLVSQATAAELKWVLSYCKLNLNLDYQIELLSDYLSYCEITEVTQGCPIRCRDVKDQIFLDLAQSGNADILVSGDADLLALAGQTQFLIETPEAYKQRFPIKE